MLCNMHAADYVCVCVLQGVYTVSTTSVYVAGDKVLIELDMRRPYTATLPPFAGVLKVHI